MIFLYTLLVLPCMLFLYADAQCNTTSYGPQCQYTVWQPLSNNTPAPYFRYPLTGALYGTAYDSTLNTYTNGTLNTTAVAKFSKYGVLGSFSAAVGSNTSVLPIVTPDLNTSSFTYTAWFSPTSMSMQNTTLFSTQNSIPMSNHFDITLPPLLNNTIVTTSVSTPNNNCLTSIAPPASCSTCSPTAPQDNNPCWVVCTCYISGYTSYLRTYGISYYQCACGVAIINNQLACNHCTSPSQYTVTTTTAGGIAPSVSGGLVAHITDASNYTVSTWLSHYVPVLNLVYRLTVSIEPTSAFNYILSTYLWEYDTYGLIGGGATNTPIVNQQQNITLQAPFQLTSAQISGTSGNTQQVFNIGDLWDSMLFTSALDSSQVLGMYANDPYLQTTDPCTTSSNPCVSHGTTYSCIPNTNTTTQITSFSCACPYGFTGQTCTGNPCVNLGVYTSTGASSYTCSNPCQNGGNYTGDGYSGDPFTCVCPVTATGTTCQYIIWQQLNNSSSVGLPAPYYRYPLSTGTTGASLGTSIDIMGNTSTNGYLGAVETFTVGGLLTSISAVPVVSGLYLAITNTPRLSTASFTHSIWFRLKASTTAINTLFGTLNTATAPNHMEINVLAYNAGVQVRLVDNSGVGAFSQNIPHTLTTGVVYRLAVVVQPAATASSPYAYNVVLYLWEYTTHGLVNTVTGHTALVPWNQTLNLTAPFTLSSSQISGINTAVTNGMQNADLWDAMLWTSALTPTQVTNMYANDPLLQTADPCLPGLCQSGTCTVLSSTTASPSANCTCPSGVTGNNCQNTGCTTAAPMYSAKQAWTTVQGVDTFTPTLTCPTGNTISVVNVFFGCSSSSYSGATAAIQTLCNGQQSCTLSSSFTNDPCPNVRKETAVTYSCTGAGAFTAVTTTSGVENTVYSPSCASGTVYITAAYYGCPSNTAYAPSTTATSAAQGVCNGKTSCSFTAGNTLYGSDPCPYVSKSTSVSYVCQIGGCSQPCLNGGSYVGGGYYPVDYTSCQCASDWTGITCTMPTSQQLQNFSQLPAIPAYRFTLATTSGCQTSTIADAYGGVATETANTCVYSTGSLAWPGAIGNVATALAANNGKYQPIATNGLVLPSATLGVWLRLQSTSYMYNQLVLATSGGYTSTNGFALGVNTKQQPFVSITTSASAYTATLPYAVQLNTVYRMAATVDPINSLKVCIYLWEYSSNGYLTTSAVWPVQVCTAVTGSWSLTAATMYIDGSTLTNDQLVLADVWDVTAWGVPLNASQLVSVYSNPLLQAIDPCSTTPCGNSFSCLPNVTSQTYTCASCPGWNATLSDTQCQGSNPCHGNGLYQSTNATAYTCINPCANGGIYIDKGNNTYACQCTNTFGGINCTTNGIWKTLNASLPSPYMYYPLNGANTAASSTLDAWGNTVTSGTFAGSGAISNFGGDIGSVNTEYWANGNQMQVVSAVSASQPLTASVTGNSSGFTYSFWWRATSTPPGNMAFVSNPNVYYGQANHYAIKYAAGVVYGELCDMFAACYYSANAIGPTAPVNNKVGYIYHIVAVVSGSPGQYTQTLYSWEYDSANGYLSVNSDAPFVYTSSFVAPHAVTLSTIAIGNELSNASPLVNTNLWDVLYWHVPLTSAQVNTMYANQTQTLYQPDVCVPNPCASTSKYCFNSGNGAYLCQCPGFNGTDSTGCIGGTNPCTNIGFYTPTSASTYTCTNPCANSGTYSGNGNNTQAYRCTCPSKYTGGTCQLPVWLPLSPQTPAPYTWYPLTTAVTVANSNTYDATGNTATTRAFGTAGSVSSNNLGNIATVFTGASGDYLPLNTTSVPLSATNFTASVWYRPRTTPTSNMELFSSVNSYNSGNNMQMVVDSTTDLRSAATDPANHNMAVTSSPGVKMNYLYHIVFTVSSVNGTSNLTQYVWEYSPAGFLSSSSQPSVVNVPASTWTSNPVISNLEIAGNNGANTILVQGDIWDVIFWNTSLSTYQATSMYQSPNLTIVDLCLVNPCQNGGICSQAAGTNTYTCSCPVPSGGVNCSVCTGNTLHSNTTGTCSSCIPGYTRIGPTTCANCAGADSSEYACSVLRDNPYHYYRLNDLSSTSMADLGSVPASGSYSNPVTLNSSSPITSDPSSRSVAFSSSGYAVSSVTTEYASSVISGSVELWYKGTPSSKAANLVGYTAGQSATAQSNHDRFVYITPTGDLYTGVCGSPSCPEGLTSSGYDFTTNSYWHHIVFTWASTGLSTYVNGTCLMGVCAGGGVGANFQETSTYPTGYWHLAEYFDVSWPYVTSGNTMPLTGSLAEFSVYSYTLNASQILKHYQSAAVTQPATKCPFSTIPYLINGSCYATCPSGYYLNGTVCALNGCNTGTGAYCTGSCTSTNATYTCSGACANGYLLNSTSSQCIAGCASGSYLTTNFTCALNGCRVGLGTNCAGTCASTNASYTCTGSCNNGYVLNTTSGQCQLSCPTQSGYYNNSGVCTLDGCHSGSGSYCSGTCSASNASYTCTGGCSGTYGLNLTTQQCTSNCSTGNYIYHGVCMMDGCQPAVNSTINTTTCSCQLPQYNTVYGFNSQVFAVNSTCNTSCVSGTVTLNTTTHTYSCACLPGWVGPNCDQVSPCMFNTHGYQTYCYNGGTCSVTGALQPVCNCTGTGYHDAQCLTSDMASNNTVPLAILAPILPVSGVIPTVSGSCSEQYMLSTCLYPGYLPTCPQGAYTLSAFDPCCPACIPPVSMIDPSVIGSCILNSCAGTACSNVSCTVNTPPACGSGCGTVIDLLIHLHSNSSNVTQALGTNSAAYVKSILLASVNRYCTIPLNWAECNLYAYTLNYMEIDSVMFMPPNTANITLTLPSTPVTPTSQQVSAAVVHNSRARKTTTSTNGSAQQLLINANSDPAYTYSFYSVSNTATVVQPTLAGSAYDGTCSNHPCYNGGICTDIGSSQHLCWCTTQWMGANCEVSRTQCPSIY